MKHLIKFNEANEWNKELEFTEEDVKKSHTNINLEDLKEMGGDDMKFYMTIGDRMQSFEFGGKKMIMNDIYTKEKRFGGGDKVYEREVGYGIIDENNTLLYVISIYEPHGYSVNKKRGMVMVHGHEQIILLWLDSGEFEETYTR